MKSDFLIAITQLAAERNLPREVVLGTVEQALVSAYKKELAPGQNISIRILPATGEVKVFISKTVVENPVDPQREVSLKEALKIKKDAALGETVETEVSLPQYAGRIAAQTVKQVVIQRLREAERELVYEEFSQKEGDIVSGVVLRIESRQVIVDLGKTEALLPVSEQVPSERYRPGQRLKVYILEVNRAAKGPQVVVSRTHRNLLRRLFELEVPEVYNGTVEIKSIARESGYRSKVAVSANQQGVDPVGSCVGLRGIRIQNIVNELHGEKIDVVQWHRDTAVFIANSLSPAQVLRVELNQKETSSTVVVPDKQLSLAIGKDGQNARLGAKLTGWKIDIKSASEAEAERLQKALEEEEMAAVAVIAVEPPQTEVEEPQTVVQEPQTVEEKREEVPTIEPLPEKEPVPILEEPEEVVAVAPAEKPQIRFAEDLSILTPLKATDKRKKAKSKKGRVEEWEKGTKARKGHKELIPSLDEDYQEYLS